MLPIPKCYLDSNKNQILDLVQEVHFQFNPNLNRFSVHKSLEYLLFDLCSVHWVYTDKENVWIVMWEIKRLHFYRNQCKICLTYC